MGEWPQSLSFLTFSSPPPFPYSHIPTPVVSESKMCHLPEHPMSPLSLPPPPLLSISHSVLRDPPLELLALTFLSISTFPLHHPRSSVAPSFPPAFRSISSQDFLLRLPSAVPSWLLCVCPWLRRAARDAWYYVAVGVTSRSWLLTSTGPQRCLAALVSHKLPPPNGCSSNLPTFLSSKPQPLLKIHHRGN